MSARFDRSLVAVIVGETMRSLANKSYRNRPVQADLR